MRRCYNPAIKQLYVPAILQVRAIRPELGGCHGSFYDGVVGQFVVSVGSADVPLADSAGLPSLVGQPRRRSDVPGKRSCSRRQRADRNRCKTRQTDKANLDAGDIDRHADADDCWIVVVAGNESTDVVNFFSGESFRLRRLELQVWFRSRGGLSFRRDGGVVHNDEPNTIAFFKDESCVSTRGHFYSVRGTA